MSNDQKICFDRVLANESEQTTVFHDRAAFYMAKRWPNEENGDGATIRIGFIGGTEEQKATVKKYAVQWTEHASLKFEFVDSGETQVRIAFEDKGSWSYIGIDAKSIDADLPTMNFGWLDEGVILHEFGHMIGLIHEHQNPNENPIKWNKQVVNASLSGPPNGWDQLTIDRNMYQKYATNQLNASDFDNQSVMLYSFPASWTSNSFHTDANVKLSDKDKEFAKRVYPPIPADPVGTGVQPVSQDTTESDSIRPAALPPQNVPEPSHHGDGLFTALGRWIKSWFRQENTTGKIKVLFLWANTNPVKPLHIDAEYNQIMKFLRLTPEWDALTFVNEVRAEGEQILQLLHNEKPDIVHFSGHGDSEKIVTHPTPLPGTIDPEAYLSTGQLTPDALGKTFNIAKKYVKLVMFNTCSSHSAAKAVVEHIPFCVSTKGTYYDPVAIQFSAYFYQGLGFGKTIQEAFEYADAGVSMTRGNVLPDNRPQILEQPGANKRQFRLRSPRTEILNRRHRKRITIAVLASILVGLIGAWLLFPTLGWLSPNIAKKQDESISTKDAALNAHESAKAFYTKELNDLGGDITPPIGFPANSSWVFANNPDEEEKYLQRRTGKVGQQELMDRWLKPISLYPRTDTEELLTIHSDESFTPPYESCRFTLEFKGEVVINSAVAFLVRDNGGPSSYRPTYRQMAFTFNPEEENRGTLFLDRPRHGDSLLMYIRVGSRLPIRGEKIPIKNQPGAWFYAVLKHRETK